MPQDNEDLLRELIDRYAKMYMKLAYDNGVPYDDVEDIVFEAFWSFYDSEYYGELDESGTKAMIACIVKRRCIDYYRKNSHYDSVSLDEGGNELEFLRKTHHKDPLEEMIENEEYREINQYIEDLKDIWKDVVIMYFVEGRSETEISELLGITGAVCRSRISRARKFLQEKLKHLHRSG